MVTWVLGRRNEDMINLTTMLHVPMEAEGFRQCARQLVSISDAYREDLDFRANFDSDPVAALVENNIDVAPDTDVRVVEDTDEVFHFVLPPDFNTGMGDEVLDMVAGGKTASAQPAPRAYRGCFSPPNLPGFTGYRYGQ